MRYSRVDNSAEKVCRTALMRNQSGKVPAEAGSTNNMIENCANESSNRTGIPPECDDLAIRSSSPFLSVVDLLIQSPAGVPISVCKTKSKRRSVDAMKSDLHYENLQPVRMRKLGGVLLAFLVLAMLANNRAIYPILESGGPSWYQGFFAAMCGVVVSQFSLLAIWSVLSSHSLLRRSVFLGSAGTALIAAWLLGFVATCFPEPVESIRWLALEEVYLLGYLPIVFLAHAIPLIGLRLFGSLVLAQIGTFPIRRPVSIAGLLGSTGIVGVALAAIQFVTLMGMSHVEALGIGGIAAGIAFAIGLLGVLPAVILLFSQRRLFWAWSIMAWLYAAGLTAAIFGGLRLLQLLPAGTMWIFVILLTTEMFMVTLGIGIMRMMGYRLVKATVEQGKSSGS